MLPSLLPQSILRYLQKGYQMTTKKMTKTERDLHACINDVIRNALSADFTFNETKEGAINAITDDGETFFKLRLELDT